MLKKSQYLQKVGNAENALYFHSLLGNLYLLNAAYIEQLESFTQPRHLLAQEVNNEIINELVEANYLVDVDCNERELVAVRNNDWMENVPNGGHLKFLGLIVSEVCNFACPHCLHALSLETGKTHGTKRLMDWETAKQAIDKYFALVQARGETDHNIHFGSAEPLLNWQVIKKSVEYIRNFAPDCRLVVNTNLSLLTQEQAIFFRDNKVYLTVSLDGPECGNDKIRIQRDGSGTYNLITQKHKLLIDNGYPLLGYSLTINDLNIDSIDDAYLDWYATQGFDGLITSVDIINNENCNRRIEEYIEKILYIRQRCVQNGIENYGMWSTAYENLVNDTKDGMPSFCKAIKGKNISVNPEGKLFICGHTTTLLGTLDNFDEALTTKSPYANLIKNRLPGNDPFCYGCAIEGLCGGHCHISREFSNATGNRKEHYLCEFNRIITFELLKDKLKRELVDEPEINL